MKLMKRVKCALTGEDGASNIEIIVWISVVLIIATVLLAFGDNIRNFIEGASGQVNSLELE